LGGHVANHQLPPQPDGGPRLMGRNHSLFRTLSQAGEAPGRVPGPTTTFTPFRTRALRASVAGRVPGPYGGSSAVASLCGWNPRLAGPGYPARKGEAHPSLVHTLIPDFWVANPFPSLGFHFTWPGAAGGLADYPPSAGLTALPTVDRALGALTFWQVALERTLGANSRSGSTGSARYRPSGPVLSVPADQKFPDHEISVWPDKAPNCYFETSGYNQQRFLGELSLVQTTACSRGLQSSSRPNFLQPFSLKSSWTSPLPRPCI